MFTYDATGYRLAHVLYNLAAVNTGPHTSGFVGVFHTILRLLCVQFGVVNAQPTRHNEGLVLGIDCDDALLAERHGPIFGEVLHHVVSISPDLANLEVSLTVDRDNPLRLFLGYFEPERLQLQTELLSPHAVTCTQNGSLTDEPLILGHVFYSHVVDTRRHILVDVLTSGELIDEIILPCEPREYPRLNLRGIGFDNGVPLGSDDGLL